MPLLPFIIISSTNAFILMKYIVNSILFDFADSCWELSEDEMIDITDESLGFWEADDDEDLIEEITTSTGYCIKSINYEIALT